MSEHEDISHIRHSLAHLLAAAVSELYPNARPTIGPATESGFYYDFEFPTPLKESDLKKIEKRMKKLLPSWDAFECKEVTENEARDYFKDNPYKLELIDDIVASGDPITLYTSGSFTDLCRGGHVTSMKNVSSDSFTLTSIAGAYWRGDENNTMLTRIYGLAFPNKEELDEHLEFLEEAKKRDHRKLGKELDLFTFSEHVGAGLPLFTPKGTILRDELQKKLVSISTQYGMHPVSIPHLAKRELYDISGHSEKFSDELIRVESRYEEFVMKPVNCPHHTQIYASRPRSYRDLPVRFMESTMQYRDEKPGEISGLTRVRSITVDDGHIFCTPDQIETEAKNIVHIIKEFYTSIGLYGDHWVSLSVRDPDDLESYIGDDEGWQKAETMLQKVSNDLELSATRVEGEAAIYGPKLDFMFKDSLGREWQLATIQIDFAMPKRFGLEYTDSDGSKKTPVMIHRAILGSYERFLAILIEHFAGAFPLWLSPTQIKVLPVSEDHHAYAEDIHNYLTSHGIRSEIDTSATGLSKKIRNARTQKVPYFTVIGDTEVKNETVTLEGREGTVGERTRADLIEYLQKEIRGTTT